MYSTDGRFELLKYDSPRPFLFSCADSGLLKGLSKKAKGMTGLAMAKTSLHTQLSTQFKLPHKFAICTPSTAEFFSGHMFIGGGPYWFPPYRKDTAKELITTPLITNPVSTAPIYREGENSDEYFIDVKSIKVDHKIVNVNTSLLSIDKEGFGGTKLSILRRLPICIVPYIGLLLMILSRLQH